MTDTAETQYPTTDQVLAKDVFNGFAQMVFDTAEKGGWHKNETFGDKLALIHSELSEALEEYRNGHALDEIYYSYIEADGTKVNTNERFQPNGTENKTEGVAAEFADAIIRIYDLAVWMNIPVNEAMFQKAEYNKTRAYRHGGKVL